jgi:4-amino-4-deoxy-L-arabinose transferase-like glycosyltransferase
VLVALGANVALGGSDRALMLGLPALAVMAAFALPTLKRSATAAIDWFSMFFFTVVALFIWVMYVAMQTGVPAKPAANVAKLAPGFEAPFSVWALGFAVAGSLAWVAVVRWRTGRHQEALWKSLVLPAGGVALCWLLLMTLGLPPLDHGRSARPLVERLAPHVPAGTPCIAAPGVSPANVAALEHFGRWRVDATPGAALGACPLLLRVARDLTLPPTPAGWVEIAVVPRPTGRDELMQLLRPAR